MKWDYEKPDENGELQVCHMNDYDGSITGHIVFNVSAWFDENPEERIRLGWIKHIKWTDEEIREKWPYNRQTQYLVRSLKQIDDYTVEDEYHVMNKSEEMLLFEELLTLMQGSATIYTYDGLVWEIGH